MLYSFVSFGYGANITYPLQLLSRLNTVLCGSVGCRYCVVDKLHHTIVRKGLPPTCNDVAHALFRHLHHLLAAIQSRHLEVFAHLNILTPDAGKECVTHFVSISVLFIFQFAKIHKIIGLAKIFILPVRK